MASGLVETAALPAKAVRAERARILATLLEQIDVWVAAAVEAMRLEIPAYADRSERFYSDVAEQVMRCYRTKLTALQEERALTADDVAFVRSAAMRRARAGFALEDYLNAFRVGEKVLWNAVVECAGATPVGHEAAVTLATPVMQFVDFVTTQAAHAYVEFQQHALADADRERRDLLEHLLAGELPARGPLLSAARAYGFGPASPLIVAVAVPAADSATAGTPYAASAAIARVGLTEGKTLVVARQGEIIAVPTLGARGDPAALCERLASAQAELRDEGMPLAMGVSTVAAGVGELPRAYLEARAAVASVADGGGFSALPSLSAFQYLTLRQDETARRLVDPSLRAFLRDDDARGGVLTATIRAFADADLAVGVAAERLHVHPNTARYRLRRIEERTGRNPRRIRDLIDLLVAIALQDSS